MHLLLLLSLLFLFYIFVIKKKQKAGAKFLKLSKKIINFMKNTIFTGDWFYIIKKYAKQIY